MTKVINAIKYNIKEYSTVMFALLMQSYFGYELIKMISFMSRYSDFINDNMFKIILTCFGFITGSAILLFMAYLYLKKKVKDPIKKLLKYILIYILIQILIAVIIGILFAVINVEIGRNISTVIQYLFRYVCIVYIFMKTEQIKIKNIRNEVCIGILITVLILALKVKIGNNLLKIMIDGIYYVAILIHFNLIDNQKKEKRVEYKKSR